MPTKTTKKTSSVSSKKKVDSAKSSVKVEKKDSTKKVVVKRRKLDLTPTRASVVAIASQANRAKKQALIDKVASAEKVMSKSETSARIPLWVWIFFWCSLLLFCISFYQAIIRPQLEEELMIANSDNETYWVDWNGGTASLWWENSNIGDVNDGLWIEEQNDLPSEVQVPKTATETIEAFFNRLSNHQFDEAYDLFTPSLQRSSEIREHFTQFRMNPFISWIQGNLKPTNFKYVSTSTYWKDRYSFDLSYTLASSQETFNEAWEFVVDTSWDEPKISSIICTTTKCSRHPIFWPESFGLMR